MFLNTLILLFSIVSLYVYWFYKKRFSHFEKRNIAYVKPTLVFGNIKEAVFLKKQLADIHKDLYGKLKQHRIVGCFNFHRPVMLICDPELIKNILVKDFEYFSNRFPSNRTKYDPITNNVGSSSGKHWRNLRIKLTPTFTSGKIKMMLPLMKDCGKNLCNVLKKSTSDEDIDFGDLCERYTTDIVTACALGLESNSLQNPESDLFKLNDAILKNQFILFTYIFIPNLPKGITKIIESTIFSQKVKRSYYSLVLDTIKYRETNKIIRNDFLGLLMELKKKSVINNLQNDQDAIDLNKFQTEIINKDDKCDLEVTNDLMVAQVYVFITTGYSIMSKAFSFALLELALNPDVQDKVRKEITSILKNNDDEFTYEAMKQMKYTDMVISEVLRKHPPTCVITRSCTQNYIIPGTEIVINEDEELMVSIYSLHSDKQYYDKPDEFYPEHFTDEAIARRPNYTYMPFGAGPRVCIASRFVMMSLKVGLVDMLKNFSYSVSSKTKFPLKYCSGLDHHLSIEGGIWLNCHKI